MFPSEVPEELYARTIGLRQLLVGPVTAAAIAEETASVLQRRL